MRLKGGRRYFLTKIIMKKLVYYSLIVSALFMVASCGSKSNSANEDEAANSTYEPADPSFTYGDGSYEDYSDKYENVPLDGCFEMDKVSLACTQKDLEYMLQATINLKMVKDYPDTVDRIQGEIQLINKDGAVIAELGWEWYTRELKAVKVGGIGVITDSRKFSLESEANELLSNTKYVRLANFIAAKKVSKSDDNSSDSSDETSMESSGSSDIEGIASSQMKTAERIAQKQMEEAERIAQKQMEEAERIANKQMEEAEKQAKRMYGL